MNWDDLRFVLAISRERTLNRAATTLCVTHTTVGRRVRAIEQHLGVRLFDRTPDGFIPTAAGQDLTEVAERMEGEVLSMEGRVLGRDVKLRGKLRVATMDIIFHRQHDLFASFIESYPQVELTVTTTMNEVSLTRREADVALRMSNAPSESLVGRKVGHVGFAAYASKALVERVGPDATYDDYPWIHWDERTNPAWLDAWLAQNAPHARITMRMDNALVLKQAIVSGIGVHFLPCFDGDADPRLQRVGPVEPRFGRDLWLLTLPDLRNTSRVCAFMEHIHCALRVRRDLLAGTR